MLIFFCTCSCCFCNDKGLGVGVGAGTVMTCLVFMVVIMTKIIINKYRQTKGNPSLYSTHCEKLNISIGCKQKVAMKMNIAYELQSPMFHKNISAQSQTQML